MPRTLLACLVCLVPAIAFGQPPMSDKGPSSALRTASSSDLGQFLANWERTQRDIKSLAVEFTAKNHDKVFGTKEKSNGALRLLRTPEGKLRVSYELVPEKSGHPIWRGGYLDSATVYFFDGLSKTQYRLKLGDRDPVEFLADYFNPLTILLDRKRAEERFEMELKRDDHYAYLQVKPKRTPGRGWFDLSAGQVVLESPKGLPKRLWFAWRNGNDVTYDITSWRMNAADSPTVADLDKAVNVPGSTVQEFEWPDRWWGQ